MEVAPTISSALQAALEEMTGDMSALVKHSVSWVRLSTVKGGRGSEAKRQSRAQSPTSIMASCATFEELVAYTRDDNELCQEEGAWAMACLSDDHDNVAGLDHPSISLQRLLRR